MYHGAVTSVLSAFKKGNCGVFVSLTAATLKFEVAKEVHALDLFETRY